jgi:ParB/RepB/Spo0J family partition protein
MRADAHYVEQLDAAPKVVTVQAISTHAIESPDTRAEDTPSTALLDSVRRHGVLEPLLVQRHSGRYRIIAGRQRLAAARALALRDVPCLIHHVDDDRAHTMRDALGHAKTQPVTPTPSTLPAYDSALAQSLSAVASCTALLVPTSARLTRTVATDLIKAEVARATYLLQASRILRRELPVVRSRVSAREIVDRVLALADAERRLRMVEIETSVTLPGDGTLWADRDQLVVGVSGMLLSILTMLEGASGARVSVSVHPDGANHVAFVVTQELMVIEEAPSGATSEVIGAYSDPFGPALAVTTLHRVALAHEGRLSTSRAGSGSRVSLALPLDARRPN